MSTGRFRQPPGGARRPEVGADKRRLGPRVLAFAGLLAALAAWFAAVDLVPEVPLWADVVLACAALLPASFGLVWLALPIRKARGLAAVGLALVVLAGVWEAADFDVAANFAKLAAVACLALWFLDYFERLAWVALVAALIPVVDALSVWRGPTRHIVTERRELFDLFSYTVPVPGGGSFDLGLPDVLFFTLFLGAAARFGLRAGWTWAAMLAALAATTALTVWVDPFGIGGFPALPAISVGFLAANGDLVWRELRRPKVV